MIDVMIIEDDPMVRDINGRFLERIEGFRLVKAAGSLAEARAFMEDNRPGLILLDVFLPRENGIDFLKWLRSEEIDVDVLLITADKTVDRVQEALRYGVVDYLIKPFNFQRFKDALLQYRQRRAQLRRSRELDQEALDQLMGGTVAEEPLAKGLNKFTYKAICQEIQKWEGRFFTAEELAEELKIARVTVRRYLDSMEKEGQLEKVVEYGKVGRPQHQYRKI